MTDDLNCNVSYKDLDPPDPPETEEPPDEVVEKRLRYYPPQGNISTLSWGHNDATGQMGWVTR